MLTHDENELITRVGAGTPMGITMRRYWINWFGRLATPCPSSGKINVSTIPPRSDMALAIWRASPTGTRGSFSPWMMRSVGYFVPGV